MKLFRPAPTAHVLMPEVVLTMTYVVVLRIWNVWTTCTLRLPTLEDSGSVALVTGPESKSLTLANAALLVLLGAAGSRARRSPLDLRRGHYAGVLLAMLSVVALQLWVVQARGPLGFLER